MRERNYSGSLTIFAKLRDEYNETPDNEFMTQQELADRLGISKATVSRYESGEKQPRAETLKKYSEIFNVPMDYLTETQPTVKMKNTATMKALGIKGDAVNTLRKIRDISTDEFNLSAVVNAFLSNEEYAVCFFQNILNYLQTEYSNQQSGHNDNRIQHDLLIRMFEDYINHVVAPQVQTAIKKNDKTKEAIADIMATPEHECSNVNDHIKYLEDFYNSDKSEI